ncbi:hypothetical protein V2J09_015874 [Rumex salicifolius]
MEKKQLNLSAPLLSARRYSSPLRSCGEEVRAEAAPNSIPANKCKFLGEVVKPGTVPFTWEQIPGRAKSFQVHIPEYKEPPRLPPGRTMSGVKSGELRFLRPHNKFSGELCVIKPPTRFLSGELPMLRSQNRPSSFPVHDMVNSAQLNKPVIHKASSDSGSDTDDDPTFSDALDALESYSMNCSTSGLSSSELPVAKTCAYSSSTDVGNRDFMMNRFLPAAKAMALESPQYASKRQTVAIEPPQLSKVIVPKIVKTTPQKNMALTLYTGQDIGSQHSEDEEENEQGFDESRSISIKACGFFPWFCSRNALRLLNPVPAVKVKTKSALASASKVGRLVKNASYKSPSRMNSKGVLPIQHKNKADHITKSCELNRIESKPSNIRSRPMFYSGELPTRNGNLQSRNGGLSPYRNYKRSSVSPLRSESPHSPFHNGVGYLIVPKRVDEHKSKPNDRALNMSGPLSFNQRKFQGSCPGSPVTEKTLYVDSVNIIRRRQTSGRMDIIKARGISRSTTHSQRSSIECQTDDILSKMTRSSKAARIGSQQANSRGRELVLRTEDPALLPPPLPKSPSESWLSRNLNAVSPRNSVSQTPPNNATTKWETIVRSNHLRYDHGRYSEELVARLPHKQSHRKK